MTDRLDFPADRTLSYLGLPSDYVPHPAQDPIRFLTNNVRMLPPDLALPFSSITTPKERTSVAVIRNRRTKFTLSSPRELAFDTAKNKWPMLWGRGGRSEQEQGREEKEWAEKEFMGGQKQELGKLGGLLAGYEEERESERVRAIRREHAASMQVVEEEEEEEEEGEEDSDEDSVASGPPEEETEEEAIETFERRVTELFIYGMLEHSDDDLANKTDLYDRVDWDDEYDAEDERESEERWFDDNDE
ncbi:hypothetical protein NEOLEDRAFT_1160394 [Neolentinus lepideus HHB14362 ss-1]|uniref:CCD97-like C-terminal domain-containing protein n=1 Tax=Neolentinus lepideus HHB14362 ss-1 TaxID=1314782 RepID=A0A165VNK6_9AGAM|nr:hypothetical protein NEOLEDRAFT_1160394 [Neolentinus lepideus HHB14362 ss-1]